MSIASSATRTVRSMSGNAITPAASAAPVVVNTSRMPSPSSNCPNGPCTPNSSSRPKPTTTGGSTSGEWNAASSSARPGKRVRATSSAAAIASGSPNRTTRAATPRLRRTASISSGVSS